MALENMCNDLLVSRLPSIKEPALVFLATDKRPLLVHLTEEYKILGIKRQPGHLPWGKFFKWAMTVVGLIPRTRQESRAPEPFMATVTIRSRAPCLLAL